MNPPPSTAPLTALLSLALIGCPSADGPQKQDSGTADTSSPGMDVVGRIWSVDLAAAVMVEPMAGGPAAIANRTNLVMATERSADTLGLRIAGAAPDGAQDVCVPTIDLVAVDFSADPVFTTTAEAVTTTLDGHGVTMLEFHVEGTLDADARSVSAGTLSWYAHADELGWIVEEGGSGAGLCTALEGFGSACVACPDGAGDCVHVAFTDVVGTAVDVADLVPVVAPCEDR